MSLMWLKVFVSMVIQGWAEPVREGEFETELRVKLLHWSSFPVGSEWDCTSNSRVEYRQQGVWPC